MGDGEGDDEDEEERETAGDDELLLVQWVASCFTSFIIVCFVAFDSLIHWLFSADATLC